MNRIALLTLSVPLALAACQDQPTAPVPEGPSFAAVHGEGVPVPELFYTLIEGDLFISWTWSDDQEWDLVSFDLVFDGRKLKGDWNIKPYAADPGGLYPVHSFDWVRRSHGETVPDLCVSVMAKNRSGKGTRTTTYHAENCNPVLRSPAGSTPVTLRKEKISAGYDHSCGLSTSGEAYCWGANTWGQLGDGTTTDRLTPMPVGGDLIFSQISTGSNFTCALATTGATYCWGRNDNGQLGDGTGVSRLLPAAVSGGLTFTHVSAGERHTCGVTPSGAAYCWGSNYRGQLGIGSYLGWRLTPEAVYGGLAFAQISAGRLHTCGLTTAGKAYCWGSNLGFRLGGTYGEMSTLPVTAGSRWRVYAQITAGGEHTCAVTPAGEGYCWGDNGYGQGGYAPWWEDLAGIWEQPVVGGLTFTEIHAGAFHTCGMTTSGKAYCWGDDVNGQLGAGGGGRWWEPTAVSGGLSLARISAGNRHNCAVTTEGRAYCWGDNAAGQVGDGTAMNQRTTPTPVAGRFATTSLSAGHMHTCAVSPARAAHCWGRNNSGQLGDGTTVERHAPTLVQDPHVFSQISASYDHSCGLTSAGRAYCWGLNDKGQLGNGTTAGSSLPTAVAGGHSFSQIHVGYRHTCALTPSGQAYCWGWNTYGQLGDGSTMDRLDPTMVNLPAVAQLSTGNLHTCALTPSGEAYCWGYNSDGQLGDLTTTQRPTPMPVYGGRVFTQLSAGVYHSCGVTASGAAYCWGYNAHGQLGDGTSTRRLAPTAVSGGFAFAAITGGGGHTCALAGAGVAYCWGRNSYGELGDGTQTNRLAPMAVSGELPFAQITAGTDHTCARTNLGSSHCWGQNSYGQLGDGTTTLRRTPTGILVRFQH
jgi:alpha-tubulin suppressor-like RCC1 family protein